MSTLSVADDDKVKLFRMLEQSSWSFPKHNIPNLFNLQSAATVLRSVRLFLNPEHCKHGERDLENFFTTLAEVESHVSVIDQKKYTPTIIVLEGIDGCGKSTQTKMLASRLCTSMDGGPRATPPPSLAPVRECFDRCGGVAARAFYVIGNYVLAQEMLEECALAKRSLVFVVDRFYSSTCGYTIGKATAGEADVIDKVVENDEELVSWPADLLRPALCVILKINEEERKGRVNCRNNCLTDNGNPWDDRMARHPDMGRRIVRVMEKMRGITSVSLEVGNLTEVELMENALAIINSHVFPCGKEKPVTVALFGTHCAGKRTIGKLVAEKLDWPFQPELGDILRPDVSLVGQDNQHREGYIAATEQGDSWDDFIYKEECKRDAETEGPRVVETWHIGNLAWALQRGEKEPKEEDIIVDEVVKAISAAQKTHKVLLVYLNVTPETTMRRRANPDFATSMLPFSDEIEESTCLHKVLGPGARHLVENSEALKHLSIPVLEVENNRDGQNFIEVAASTVIHFMKENKFVD